MSTFVQNGVSTYYDNSGAVMSQWGSVEYDEAFRELFPELPEAEYTVFSDYKDKHIIYRKAGHVQVGEVSKEEGRRRLKMTFPWIYYTDIGNSILF